MQSIFLPMPLFFKNYSPIIINVKIVASSLALDTAHFEGKTSLRSLLYCDKVAQVCPKILFATSAIIGPQREAFT